MDSAIRTTSRTGDARRAFTLLELAVVVAIIFILASSLVVMIPMIELKAAKAKAKGDIQRLDLALSVYKEAEGALPPDRYSASAPYPLLGIVNPFTPTAPLPSAEQQSNVYLVHYLTTRRSRDGYIELKPSEVSRLSGWTLRVNIGDSLLVPGTITVNFPPYMFLDPWGNPYVYDNNQQLAAERTTTAIGKFDGLPNHNPDFDLFSRGPNGVTAEDNGINDDYPADTQIDEADEVLYNGRERRADGDVGDDISNFKTDK